MLALIECVRGDEYESSQTAFSTYIVPFLDGAMRRYLETNLGTLSLDKKSMALVRKAQRLYADRKSVESIAVELDITTDSVARAVLYPIHFLSVYDLALPENGNDVYDYISADLSAIPPHQLIYQKIRMEYFREMFFALSKKDQDILGKCYGVFGYRKESLLEIAIYHMMKESAVEKAKTGRWQSCGKRTWKVRCGSGGQPTGRSMTRSGMLEVNLDDLYRLPFVCVRRI